MPDVGQDAELEGLETLVAAQADVPLAGAAAPELRQGGPSALLEARPHEDAHLGRLAGHGQAHPRGALGVEVGDGQQLPAL